MKTDRGAEGDARQARVGRAAVFAVCVVAGLVEWSVFVVGRVGDASVPTAFWVSILLTVAVVGVSSESSAAGIAAATFSGPLLAAGWTTPRGDNDGLWSLIFLLLAMAAVLGCVEVVILRRAPPSAWVPRILERVAEAHLGIVSTVVLLGGLGSAWLLIERRADPYDDLERLVATFPAPTSFEPNAIRRGGDPLCNLACRASVAATFTTPQAPITACDTLRRALSAWPEADAQPQEPIFGPESGYFEICSWRVDIDGTDGSAAVSDEPSGTSVTVTLLDPRGR